MKLSSEFSALLLVFVMFLIIFCLVKYHWSRRDLYIFASQLPGPVVLPVVGNGLEFMYNKEDTLGVVEKMTQPYPSPSKIWLASRLLVFVKDPDQLQIVLNSNKIATKAYVYQFLEPFMGKGLFTSSGNTHKNHRKLFQPFFSQRVLDGYSHLFQKHAKRFASTISKHLDGSEFDILNYLHESAFEATMDILLEDKNVHSIDYKEIPRNIRRFYSIFFTRVITFWLHPDFIYKKTSYFKIQNEMTKIKSVMTKELMTSLVPDIIKRIENGQYYENKEARTPSVLEMLIEMLYENPSLLSEEECVDHMLTFVITSQDTQSSAIAFTCMMLGAYPEIQDACYKEIREAIGDRKELDLTDVSKLHYLEMCIKESMRLYPVAPFLFRDTTEEFKLGKYTIPKDVTVGIGIYNVHRDPNHWERPLEYYPEHFAPEAVKNRHPYAFLPFSAGPRRCIAQHYSYVNMKILMATLLLNYKLECRRRVEDIKLKMDITIRPVEGYMVKIAKRD